MNRWTKLALDREKLYPQERAALDLALTRIRRMNTVAEQGAFEALAEVVGAVTRHRTKKRSDRKTDMQRRVLIGARVNRAFAERCRAAAGNRTMYRFTMDALEAECRRKETQDAVPASCVSVKT